MVDDGFCVWFDGYGLDRLWWVFKGIWVGIGEENKIGRYLWYVNGVVVWMLVISGLVMNFVRIWFILFEFGGLFVCFNWYFWICDEEGRVLLRLREILDFLLLREWRLFWSFLRFFMSLVVLGWWFFDELLLGLGEYFDLLVLFMNWCRLFMEDWRCWKRIDGFCFLLWGVEFLGIMDYVDVIVWLRWVWLFILVWLENFFKVENFKKDFWSGRRVLDIFLEGFLLFLREGSWGIVGVWDEGLDVWDRFVVWR